MARHGIGEDNPISVLPFPQLLSEGWAELNGLLDDLPEAEVNAGRIVLPVEPRSFRDFMLFEKHINDAARGMVKRFLPRVARVAGLYESTGVYILDDLS